jgi:FkbM family methyltransferase
VVRTISSPELQPSAKVQFIRHGLWLRSGTEGSYRLPLAEGELVLSYANNETDRNVVWDVFFNRCYGDDFTGATVLDVGAHKGYFGAYALLHGAKRVRSYEPERVNFEFLNLTAQSFTRNGRDWETQMAAVAATDGEVELRVDSQSWAHSIASLTPTLAAGVDTQVIAGVAMEDVVASASDQGDGIRLIAKIDAEGAECAIVLQTPVATWRQIDEVFIEVHDFADCSRSQLVEQLGLAGHVLVDERFGVIHLRQPAEMPVAHT